jgi:uncharacterized FlaG/YvyC family protein
MSAISSVSPTGYRNAGYVISEAFNLQDGKVSSQKREESLRQINLSISKVIRQFLESTDLRLDFEIDNKNKCVSIKVINNFSGEVIREIPVKSEVKMGMLKGVICQTFA